MNATQPLRTLTFVRIVVLVGAGASVGAFEDGYARPPLGIQLFGRLVERYPATWGDLSEAITAEFQLPDAGFERGMAALWKEGMSTQAALIDMSIYFAEFRIPPHGTNRYFAVARMLDALGQDVDYTFASLNYEILLEQSLGLAGHGVYYWGTPDGSLPRPVHVIKPHGSSNFAVDTGTNTFAGNTFSGVTSAYIVGAPLKVVDIAEVPQCAVTGFPAAMSLHAPGKPSPICPKFAARFREDWATAVMNADVLVVIGARPVLESDPHVWSPVIDSDVRIIYAGGTTDEDFRAFAPLVENRLTLLGDTLASAMEPLRTWLRIAAKDHP
jgi:hypothetical protein